MTGTQYHCKVLQGRPRLLPAGKEESALLRTSLVREIVAILPKIEFLGMTMHTQENEERVAEKGAERSGRKKVIRGFWLAMNA